MYNTYLKKILSQKDFNNLLESNFCKSSFSQFGEDLVVNKILSKIPNGNFLDLGSFHPIHFSNTFLLYLRGWRGINIDANIELIEISKKIRPLDKSIFAYLSNKNEEVFYIKNYKHPSMNRLSKDISDLEKNEEYITVNTDTLENLIKGYEILLKNLYYLNIDLEFSDEKILKNFNFNIYHPLLITIENQNFNFYNENSICKFLKNYNYSLYSYVRPTAFYIDNNFFEKNFNIS